MKAIRYSFLSTLFLLLFIPLNSIFGQQCNPSAQIDLDVNNVRARLPQGGALWWDFNNAGYIVPKDNLDQVAAIFAGGIWVGGLDPGGNLKMSAVAYGQGPSPGSAGPLVDGISDPQVCQNFDRFWKISLQEVLGHIQDYADNGIIDNPISAIFSWPGTGNAHSLSYNGFELPPVFLAPFVDLNSNGFYEPEKGDYPNIKGDESIWWMFNAVGELNFLSPNTNVSVMAYGFNSADEVLRHTTYYDVSVENAGLENLDSTFFGLWVDPDLGCYTDDYVGCKPEHNLAFVYNEDAMDGDPNCAGVANYGDEVPILGIKFLKGMADETGNDLGLSSFICYNNASIGLPNPPPPGTTDPNSVVEYFNYLNGKWRDGTPITTGGNGYLSGGDVTNYLFAGDPGNPNDWTMCSEQQPSYDRRMLMSSGPFLLEPGEKNAMSFAVIFLADQAYPCPGLGPLMDACEVVENAYQNATSSEESVGITYEVKVFPNPISSEAQITVTGDITMQQIRLCSLDGRVVKQMNNLNTKSIELVENELPSGMYIYSVSLSNGRLASGKIVVK